jgi:Protein of unknown function (DUF2939)
MRKLLILPFVLAPLIYAAWPGWSALQLRAAVKARDLAGIESRVEWPALRGNLKQTIGTYLKEESGPPDAGLFSTLRRTLGPLVADQMVEIAVTPRTLAFVLAGGLAAGEIKRDTSTADERDAEVDAVSDQLSLRRLRWAFFETPTRFRVEATARTDPTKRVVSIFALKGASWKLIDLYYRTP